MPLFGRRRSSQPTGAAVAEPTLPEPPAPGPNGLRSMVNHRNYLLSVVEELPPFGQQILDALGLCICEDVESPVSLPGFDNSAMDGYAVHSADVVGAANDQPVHLPVVGAVPAGQTWSSRLAPGTTVKIMTGAPLPEGADAVVPYELTDRGSRDVAVFAAVDPGAHVRRLGEDVEAGQTVLQAGERLTERSIGLLAGIGRDKVLVRPRPRVVVIATGSELVEPGLPLTSPDQIYDSNSYTLAAAAKAAGAQVYRVGRVSDEPAEVKQVISDQLVRADLLLTSGGVSQGDYDVVKAVLPELGLTDFASVAMQPGKPQGFGLIGEDRTPMIMLPGNPVSAFVSFEAFARPVIRKLMGATPYVRPAHPALATEPIRSLPGRMQLARGVVTFSRDGTREVALAGGHASHLLGDLARANALILLPPEVDFVGAGDEVEVWLLDDEQ